MNNRHKANTVNTKATLSILGIVGLIVGALFLAGFLQRNLFVLPLTYGQPYTTLQPVTMVNLTIQIMQIIS
jgi:uncharacterized membrane protein YkgB